MVSNLRRFVFSADPLIQYTDKYLEEKVELVGASNIVYLISVIIVKPVTT